MEKTRNAYLDIYRVIAAILIIMIHTCMSIFSLKFVANTIGRYGVPIFMMITGYFYFNNPTKERRNKTLKSLLQLWIVWNIIYIPEVIHRMSGMNLIEKIKMSIWGLIGFSQAFGGSWYLLATSFGIIFVDYLRRKNLIKLSIFASIIVYIIDLITTNYGHLVNAPYSLMKYYLHNTIFTGILWITIAYLISKNKENIDKFGKIRWVIITLLLIIIEYFVVQYFGGNPIDKIRMDMYIFLPLAAPTLFMYMLNKKFMIKRENALILRDWATLIFFMQFGVIDVLELFSFGKYMFAFLTIIITVVLALIIVVISRNSKFKFLRILY